MGNAELWRALKERDELLANAHEHFDEARYTVVEETIKRHDRVVRRRGWCLPGWRSRSRTC